MDNVFPPQNPVGIYEKAFPAEYSWEQILTSAKLAGYDFVEMSIDESPKTPGSAALVSFRTRPRFDKQSSIPGCQFGGWVLVPTASSRSAALHPNYARQGLDILYRSIELAADLGVRVIQIMGYDAFYEPSNAETQARYLEGLQTGVKWASAAGIILALENGDSELVDSVEKAMRFVKMLNSPWFQVYPDIGNMTAAGYSPLEQLPLTEGHLVGVHVKDTRKGELRGVPLGQGIVQFRETFRWLAQMGFTGPW